MKAILLARKPGATRLNSQADVRCYVCKQPLPEVFSLIALAVDTDRVFTIHAETCAKLVDDAQLNIVVCRKGST